MLYFTIKKLNRLIHKYSNGTKNDIIRKNWVSVTLNLSKGSDTECEEVLIIFSSVYSACISFGYMPRSDI